MKKLLTIALALIMALAVSAPAMAFTNVDYDDSSSIGPQLAIKLVDIEQGSINVNFTAPPSNRGYLRNEVVCAVVSLYVPSGYDFEQNNYTNLEFSGNNLSLYQEDNFYAPLGVGSTLNYMSKNAYDVLVGKNAFSYSSNMSVDNTITLNATGLEALDYTASTGLSKDTTYQFAVFGKVLADNASMTASLKGLGGLFNSTTGSSSSAYLNIVKLNDDYSVGYHNPNITAYTGTQANGISASVLNSILETNSGTDSKITLASDQVAYVVYKAQSARAAGTLYSDTDALFVIITDRNYNCVAMYVYYPNTIARWYGVKVVSRSYPDAEYASFWDCYLQFEYFDGSNWYVQKAGVETSYLMHYLCRDVIYEDFGLNPGISGRMKDSWWSSNKEISVEVAIEPWYTEVEVPTEIEISAPKTGAAMNALGAILVLTAAFAFVAARKVKA